MREVLTDFDVSFAGDGEGDVAVVDLEPRPKKFFTRDNALGGFSVAATAHLLHISGQ